MNYFYSNNIKENQLFLENQEKIHCINSLRNKIGDTVNVVDGRGNLYECKIIKIMEATCKLNILRVKNFSQDTKVHIMIAPTKNHKRIDWMVEKLVEIGVYRISFLKCQNSIRREINLSRLEKIALSAMKQTQNYFLPIIDDCIDFYDSFELVDSDEKYIAHLHSNSLNSLVENLKKNSKKCILIGPEGDFTVDEINYALKLNFSEISLGKNRLRTETAGIVSATILNNL